MKKNVFVSTHIFPLFLLLLCRSGVGLRLSGLGVSPSSGLLTTSDERGRVAPSWVCSPPRPNRQGTWGPSSSPVSAFRSSPLGTARLRLCLNSDGFVHGDPSSFFFPAEIKG